MTPGEPEKTSGEGDGPYLTPVQQNKIVSMMLNPRRRWRVSKAAKAEALDATISNMGDEDGRVRNAAVANLIRMEAQNLQDQHKMLDKLTPETGDLNQVAKELNNALTAAREDVEYARLRRAAAVRHSGKSGANGTNGKSGPLANGSSPFTG
jgi:hypothetical protein